MMLPALWIQSTVALSCVYELSTVRGQIAITIFRTSVETNEVLLLKLLGRAWLEELFWLFDLV